MVLITGPLENGQTEVAATLAEERGISLESCRVEADAFRFLPADDLPALADTLSENDFVLLTEVGSGLVPVDPEERAFREQAGRLSVLLAERASEVYRVFCGIPKRLK